MSYDERIQKVDEVVAEGGLPGDEAAEVLGPPTVAISTNNRRVLLVSQLVSNLLLFMTYAAVIGVFLPQQVALIDPANKVGNLAIVTGISSFATLFAQPIVGALSDRTRARWGRRSPWIVVGALAGGVLCIVLQFAPNVFWIALIWVAGQVALNAFQAPLSAIIADRVPPSGRATASAFAGVGITVGIALGSAVAGRLLFNIGLGYTIFGIAIMVVALAFVVVNPDRSTADMPRQPFSWLAFAKGFWVSPRKHPDFAWAFGGRFFMVLGYQAVSAYQLYILTDYLHLTTAQAGTTIGTLALVSMVCVTISTLVFGRLSDHFHRRRMFVFIASIVMACGVLVPIVAPTVTAMIIYTAIVGFGYGAYTAVDAALMIDVLPSRGDIGKDLGVLNIAANVPQALTPVIAALLLGVFGGNYAAIFVYAAIAVVISSFLVFPIKSVK